MIRLVRNDDSGRAWWVTGFDGPVAEITAGTTFHYSPSFHLRDGLVVAKKFSVEDANKIVGFLKERLVGYNYHIEWDMTPEMWSELEANGLI